MLQPRLRTSVPGALAVLALCAAIALLLAPRVEAARPTCGGRSATIVSNQKRVVGTRGPDVIVGGPGVNVIFGRGGNDTICGGGNNDRIHGGRGSDRLYGGAGRDHLDGDTGNDRLNGGPGRGDRVEGGPGDDKLFGGAGSFDLLTGGPGRDRLDGGPGAHDIAVYRDAGGPLQIHLGAGRVSGAEQERLHRIDDAIGGPGDDTIVGSHAHSNRLDGGPGDDLLFGAGPGDSAFGGPGNNRCEGRLERRIACGEGGGGDHTAVALYRGIGDRTSLTIAGSDANNDVTVESVGGSLVVRSNVGVSVQLGDSDSGSCERAAGGGSVSCRGEVTSIVASLGAGDDIFAIASSVPARVAAVIDGGGGADQLYGGRGEDTIYGGDDLAANVLSGGGGDDVLYGVNIFHPRRKSGPATMRGGRGDDLLIGAQPCNGDHFVGGPGRNDSASFARVRNRGIFVAATIGGAVRDPDISHCRNGHIEHSVEKIEGSPGPDRISGDNGPNQLLGRGGDDRINGQGGFDRCSGGGGRNRIRNCEKRL